MLGSPNTVHGITVPENRIPYVVQRVVVESFIIALLQTDLRSPNSWSQPAFFTLVSKWEALNAMFWWQANTELYAPSNFHRVTQYIKEEFQIEIDAILNTFEEKMILFQATIKAKVTQVLTSYDQGWYLDLNFISIEEGVNATNDSRTSADHLLTIIKKMYALQKTSSGSNTLNDLPQDVTLSILRKIWAHYPNLLTIFWEEDFGKTFGGELSSQCIELFRARKTEMKTAFKNLIQTGICSPEIFCFLSRTVKLENLEFKELDSILKHSALFLSILHYAGESTLLWFIKEQYALLIGKFMNDGAYRMNGQEYDGGNEAHYRFADKVFSSNINLTQLHPEFLNFFGKALWINNALFYISQKDDATIYWLYNNTALISKEIISLNFWRVEVQPNEFNPELIEKIAEAVRRQAK